MAWLNWSTVGLLLFQCIFGFILALRFSVRRYNANTSTQVSAQVLVLGDIGRSPRMQYHALSIAKHDGDVQLIGYKGEPTLAHFSSSYFVSFFLTDAYGVLY